MIPAEVYCQGSPSWLATPVFFGRRERLNETGDYYVPPWHPGVAVVLASEGLTGFVNVCRHRQAVILSGTGNIPNISCAMHGWSWDLSGKSIASPGFETGADLMRLDLQEKGGWMFAPRSTFAEAVENNPHMSMSGYALLESNIYEYECSWLDYVNVSVELNHVPFIHPGLRTWMDCSDPEIIYGDGWSVQSVPFRGEGRVPGSAGVWWNTLVEKFPDAVHSVARWTHIYPNIMIEEYAGIFVGTAIIQPAATGCTIYENVWVHRDVAEDTEVCNAFSDMYAEIEDEDRDLMMAQQTGRNLLVSMGISDAGPYRESTELAMKHFHNWLLDQL